MKRARDNTDHVEIQKAILRGFPMKNRVYGEPLDLCNAVFWQCWCGASDYCLRCRSLCESYEVTCEWGDTKQFEYFSELCSTCCKDLISVCRNVGQKEYNKYMPGIHPFEKHCDKCNATYIPHVDKHICENKEVVEEVVEEVVYKEKLPKKRKVERN